MSRYLVIGGSGFIGTNLVQLHQRAGHDVISLDVNLPRCAEHRASWIQGDILNFESLSATFDSYRPTHIYHLGARTDLDGKTMECYQANTQGVSNVIKVCSKYPSVKRVLFASSRLVCKIGYQPDSYADYCPTTAYGESKVAGERLLASMGVKHWSWSVFRPTSIWGPWFGVPYRTFFDSVRRGLYVHPAYARVKKSFGYVGNSVFQIAELMRREDVVGRTFYIGDYEPIDVLEFARAIALEFGVRPPRQVPLPVLKVAAKAGDLLEIAGIRAPLTTFRLANLCAPMVHDFEDLKEVVGPLPFSQAEGIAQTVEWMRSHG